MAIENTTFLILGATFMVRFVMYKHFPFWGNIMYMILGAALAAANIDFANNIVALIIGMWGILNMINDWKIFNK